MQPAPRYRRVLLKLSGEGLMGEREYGLDPKMGAMVDESQMTRVLGYIDAGKKEGAKLSFGGNRVRSETGGYYIEPTLFDGVNNGMKIAVMGWALDLVSGVDPRYIRRFAPDEPTSEPAMISIGLLSEKPMPAAAHPE